VTETWRFPNNERNVEKLHKCVEESDRETWKSRKIDEMSTKMTKSLNVYEMSKNADEMSRKVTETWRCRQMLTKCRKMDKISKNRQRNVNILKKWQNVWKCWKGDCVWKHENDQNLKMLKMVTKCMKMLKMVTLECRKSDENPKIADCGISGW
jgi:hypothetical protein